MSAILPTSVDPMALPTVTRALVVWLPVSYILCVVASHSVLKYTALIPANTFLVHAYPWNVLTHTVFENNGIFLFIALASLVTMGKKLEEEWGKRRFILLLLVSTLTSSIGVIVATAVLYSSGSMALHQYFAGFLPCVMGIMVGYWQRCPDEVMVQFRVRYLPAIGLLLCGLYEVVFGPVTPTEADIHSGADDLFAGSDTFPAVCGLFWSWFFLRFIYPTAFDQGSMPPAGVDSGLCGLGFGGDPSPSFALDQVLPPPLRPLLAPVTSAGFLVVRCIGLGGAVAEYDPVKQEAERKSAALAQRQGDPHAQKILVVSHSGDSPADGTLQPLPGSSADEAERRRQKARQALQERLDRQNQQAAAAASAGAANASTPTSQTGSDAYV